MVGGHLGVYKEGIFVRFFSPSSPSFFFTLQSNRESQNASTGPISYISFLSFYSPKPTKQHKPFDTRRKEKFITYLIISTMSSNQHYTTTANQPPSRAVPPGVGYRYVPARPTTPPTPPPTAREYFATVSGQPPSRSVPPGVGFQAYRPAPSPPATPQAKTVRFDLNNNPSSFPSPPPPPPPPAPAASSSPKRHFEIPGVRFNGTSAPLIHDGAAVTYSSDYIRIHFFTEGARPFESDSNQKLDFEAIWVPKNQSVTDTIIVLGGPRKTEEQKTRYGVTECLEVGEGRWVKGQSWTAEGPGSQGTRMEELQGSPDWRGEGGGKVIWLANFDKVRHGW